MPQTDKITIKIVKSTLSGEGRQIESLQWLFISNTLGYSDFKHIEELGLEVYGETECIDERASAQTILIGKIRIEKNVPGGGFDYFNKKDLQRLLFLTKGQIVLDPHRNCGWGGIRLNFYQNYSDKITSVIKDTTMVMDPGQHFENGIDYIKTLVARAFRNNNFLNSVMRSAKLQNRYSYRKDFDDALKQAFPGDGKLVRIDKLHGELIDLAFAYGKQMELKQLFEEEAHLQGITDGMIRLNPDLLFDQPAHHVAEAAIFNLTDRRLLRRFMISGHVDSTFFIDVEPERLAMVMNLTVSILEGAHSETSDSIHDLHMICTASQLPKVQKVLLEYKQANQDIKQGKNIFIHIIENDELPKSKQELLNFVR